MCFLLEFTAFSYCYTVMCFCARFYYYFEHVNVDGKFIKVVLNLKNSFVVCTIAAKERKIIPSTLLMNEAD